MSKNKFILLRILITLKTLHFALFLYRLTPPDGVQPAFVLGVSKKEALMRQEILAVNRFLFCRGKEVIGQGDMVEAHQRAVINCSFYSCLRMCTSQLENLYTVTYKDGRGRI